LHPGGKAAFRILKSCVLPLMDTIETAPQPQPHAPPPPGEKPPPQPPHAPDAEPPPIELPGKDEEQPGRDNPPEKKAEAALHPPRGPWPRRGDRFYGYGGRGRSPW